MSATAQIDPVTSISSPIPEVTLMLGLGMTSFAALLLELALTRLFSVVLFYHFAFLAISIALLGLGAGGVFAYLFKQRLEKTKTRALAAGLCIGCSVAIFVVLEVDLHVRVALAVTGKDFLHLTALYLVSALPFFFTGVQFSAVFARETWRVARLYGADLCGGALACLAVVPLLNWLGGPNTILAGAGMMAAAAVVWSDSARSRRVAGGVAAAYVLLIAANYSGRWIDVVYAKGLFRDPSWVEFARWNALSRVEVDRQGQGKAIVIDADASTYLLNCDLAHWRGSEWEKNLMSAPPALANVLRPHGDFAIIGPGGGVDVLRAVASGSPSVTGIEINPIIANTIMRGRYADYAMHLYERPEVHIQVTDGRSYLRATARKFDVVQMTLVDTWASTAAGAFALSENNLYTVEAFKEYFEHLKPDGMIAITRWEFRQPREALRVVAVAMEALHQLGIGDTVGNFIVISEGPLNEDGIAVAVLAKKNVFTLEEQNAVKNHLAEHDELVPLYLPFERAEGVKNAFAELIVGNDPYRFARSYAFNVAPVDDNAPFFFFTLKAGQILGRWGLERGIDWKVNLGVLVLLLVLAISAGAVLLFLILPLAVKAGRQSPLPLLYFVAVGMGYILVEIAFIQRFVLFLGHPTYALTVVIFLLLLSSGAGSLISRGWPASAKLASIPLTLIVAALAANLFCLPQALAAWVGMEFGYRLMISAGLLIPLGFVMGMPFPTGLRVLGAAAVQSGENAVEWAWAMNAAASVLGSVLAMVITIQFGLPATLACGMAAYLLALVLFPALVWRRA